LPPLEARLGDAPEDFQVDEIPAYLPCGSGSHRYLRIRKRLMNTQDLLHQLANAAGVPQSEIGSAGMKDRNAVTTQWVSIPAQCRPTNEWQLPEGIEILQESLHTNKLRTGHLIGNRFALRLVGATESDKNRFGPLWQRLMGGIYNSYGAQRFGHNGSNLGRALQWLKGDLTLKGPKARFYKKLYPSVVQAEIFNRYLIERIAASLQSPLEGEVVRLSGSGSRFVVKAPEVELPRWQARDIVPMGPMVGAKIHPPLEAAALEIQQRATSEVCSSPEPPQRLLAEAPGTHRDLLLFLQNATFEWLDDQSLTLCFELPAGAYATEVLRELTQRGPAHPPETQESET
jgi:tRNA pseudouridine13 synthase